MKTWWMRGLPTKPLVSALLTVSLVALSGFADGGKPSDGGPVPLTVPKATCGPNDHPETGLQGQVPAALRATGFQGFNCNLELIGQSKGDGANWQTAQFSEGRSRCAYHGTGFATANRTHVGVPVIDITDANNPTPTGYLQTISMLDPWESLKVNERRKLLAATDAHNGGLTPPMVVPKLMFMICRRIADFLSC